MKKKFLCIIVLLIIGNLGFAQMEFGWSAAEWGIPYDIMHNKLTREIELAQFNFLIFDKFNITVSALNLQFQEYENINNVNFVIFPTELGIAPWVVHWNNAYFFPLLVYGKGSWLFSSNGYNSFYGSAGIRLSLFFRPEFLDSLYYVTPLTVFLEYTTAHELRIGISVDLLITVSIFGNLI